MKQVITIGLNYGKSLKSEEKDENEEAVFAEINLVLCEPKYKLSNIGKVEKLMDVSETEFYITKTSALELSKKFKEIHEKLIELEDREGVIS